MLAKGEHNTKRQLGLLSATALVVANMVGFGVFTTSGFLLADLHSPWLVLLIWVLGGGMAALGALNYGALGRRIPESGGEYLFLSRTLHPAAGYVAGWISLLVGFSAPLAFAAKAFGDYGEPWIQYLAPGLSPLWSGTILLAVFSVLHSLSVRSGAKVQNGAVLLKIGLILFFILWASPYLQAPAEHDHPAVPVSMFGVSLMWVSLSYSGWNAAVYVAGEIHDPCRNLPKSLLLGVGIVTLLYLGINAVFLFSAAPEQLKGKPEIGLIAARTLGGENVATSVSALISLALVTSVSSMVMTGPRVYAKMAQDGYLPQVLTPDGGPPRGGLILQFALSVAFLWTATYEWLLTYIGFTLGLSTAFTVIGLVLLRLKEGKELRIPGWPWVPALFLLGILITTTFSLIERTMNSGVGLGVIALGIVAWWIHSRFKRRGRNGENQAAASDEATPR